MDRPKRARVAVDYAESDASDSESEAFDPDEESDASADDDYEDDDVEESEEDESVEEDEDDDDILLIDDDPEEWDPESIRQQVMLEFNQAYASFGDFTSQDTRDAFRWIWNIERGERLVPVAELVSDSTLVQEHVSALGEELDRAADGPEGDYLLKATELQERHREFLHSGIVKETRLLATRIGIRYDARKLSEHGGIPHAYRCRRVVCELFAAFLVRVIPGNVRAQNEEQRRVLGDLPPGVADPVAERIAPAVSAADIWRHIEDDMKSLDVDRYIRRCIGGAVAMLTLARREKRMPSWYDRWFQPNHYTRFARTTGAGSHHRTQVLGASRTADVADGDCRLMVHVINPSRSDWRDGRWPANICVHAPHDTPLMSVLDVARERYADVRAFFSQNGGIPQLFFATECWLFLVRAAIGTLRDWDTSTFMAVYDVPERTHTCEVPFASIFLERRYPSDQQIQSISLKFETAIRNNNFLQRFVGQDDVNGPVDEDEVKKNLRACWHAGTKLTLDASLATLSLQWRDHVQAPRSYQLLNLNAKRKTPFPKTDRAYAKLRERLQSGIDTKVALLSERWKRWTLNRLHSFVDSIDPRWGIRPGNRFQRFCYAMSDVHSIEITSQRIPIEL
jgi:hypothetical protein